MTTFKIGDNDNPYQIIAETKPDYSSTTEGLILESLSGWDDIPENIRNRSEKIIGNGEFVSQYWRMNGRSLEATLIYVTASISQIRNLRTKLASWKTSNDLFPVSVIRTFDDEQHVEVLEDCYMDGPVLWDEKVGKYVRFNVVIKSRNSHKKLIVGDAPSIQII